MSDLVDQTITELRANHDRLRAVVEGLREDQLSAPSGASEWTVADVLSHLGSGGEISWHAIASAVGATTEPKPENQDVWDRWNAMEPGAQAKEFLASDDRLISLYEGLSPEQREETTVDLGFLPAPVALVVPLAMRLNEHALHGWDARVGLDPAASLSEQSADLILRHHAESMPFLLGFTGKADQLSETTRVAVGEHTLVVTDAVSIEDGAEDTTATFVGPLEAAVRLLAGRLAPARKPAGVDVTGNVSLDELRVVFPGY